MIQHTNRLQSMNQVLWDRVTQLCQCVGKGTAICCWKSMVEIRYVLVMLVSFSFKTIM